MNNLEIMIYSLIIAALLPFIAKVPLAYAMRQVGSGNISGYDNEHPRSQQKKLEGFGARCLAAHENSFEAMIYFAPSVLLAIALEQTTRDIALLSAAFIAARLLYLLCYWLNWDKLRSTSWAIGLGSSIAIMVKCL